MAHTRSARKRARAAAERRLHNRSIRSRVKTYIAKVEKLILAGDPDSAEGAVKQAVSALDKAAHKGVYHPNNAARHKSRLMKKLNTARAVSPHQEGLYP